MVLREIPMRNKCKKTYLLTGHWAMGMRDASGGSHTDSVGSEHFPNALTYIPFQTVMQPKHFWVCLFL